MAGKIFLAGGGSENQTYVIDELFLKNVNKVLYIPIAWKNEDFEGCLNWFKGMLSKHKGVNVNMLTDLTKDLDLKDYDAIYIGGGNTFKLLKKIKESGFDKKLVNYYNHGGKIYGGSAGAIIFGRDINIAHICSDADTNDVGLEDTSGMNLVNNCDIQCHFFDNQLKEHEKYSDTTGFNLLCIPEESAVLLDSGNLSAIGPKPVTVIYKTEVKKVKEDAILV